MANELKKQEFSTNLSQWVNSFTGLVSRDFNDNGVKFDSYSKQCAMNAMSAIYQLVKTSGVDLAALDTSNLREVIGACASLKLNANAVPREVYFQVRKKKIGQNWVNSVEMGIEGSGNDAILRNFGDGIEKVYPVWTVCEGDEFAYPKYRGIEIVPPEWERKGLSERVVRVVYPIKLNDGTVQYLISERESVRTNLLAHIRNNLLNETFGLAKSRYDANEQQKQQIDARKQEILDAARECKTVDEMLACEKARPYISAAWLDSPESMIVRKMRNNAIKKVTKNFSGLAQKSYLSMDETYAVAQDEIAQNANAEEFVVDDAMAVEV